MDPAALALAERSAPRYTSYPTAPHFSKEIGDVEMRDWLAALDPCATLSLYFHVPFCREICAYCGCHTKAVRQEAPLTAYKETLLREVEMTARATRARNVASIHWGGGTPGILGPARFGEIVERLRDLFDVTHETEHAIELDPRLLEPDMAEALARAGVNRVSFGVQDLNAHVQEAAGRVQPFEIVERAVALMRGVGVSAINLDLMYGLPLQSVADVERTASMAASLDPQRLAVFGYAHVPWFKANQKLIDAAALPGAAERLAQAAAVRRALERAGYEAIGLDHFARPSDPLAVAARQGRMRRNFQGYTIDSATALLPFGVSSIGRLPQGFVGNATDLAGWRRAVEADRFPVTRGLAFSVEDLARSEIIERLMCDFTVDFGAVALEHGFAVDAFDQARLSLSGLERDGVVELRDRRVSVTERGRPFVRLAAAAFDAYLEAGAARHSAAV
ncbi:oxygen-independent coproporphyrinogen III oxidase [Methylocystis sp. MJC1]|jgi:oxygen-independent coproporphyrinogen-3 oxidase|uniref:oxygen-independent coproporphyrinogen III oxidase n=1 Tax=Methylocystis sp. MJC1 TaxID=2654282 RepID=UPI0013E9DC08|nr:oxygen-independent coproporphyrinogen III oxidase [Methylocystis sp. MJC1]KAF2990926.1 Oxygen-independent coproporphyrinogen-III oxidase [Methylocystis sp. MJC1]MBU6527820.1 oxygen-independent coproporphyrinogen III oxidase [Methylocystis sp. MJC1]UZX10746.1 oxygen-independent coproporphyrinogen III oxidase [Methylocystis sp. MJC1]